MISLGIANSSPLIALAKIHKLDLITGQFERLMIPEAVASEVGEIPDSILVQKIRNVELLATFPPRIHFGEAEVILLGLETPGAVLIIDDWYAREFASHRNLNIMGTIGLIIRAKRVGLLPLIRPVLDSLHSAGFRMSDRVIKEALALAGE